MFTTSSYPSRKFSFMQPKRDDGQDFFTPAVLKAADVENLSDRNRNLTRYNLKHRRRQPKEVSPKGRRITIKCVQPAMLPFVKEASKALWFPMRRRIKCPGGQK